MPNERTGDLKVVHLPQTTSTLDVIHELAAKGEPAWTVVTSDHQTAGRGRRGHPSISAPGDALLAGVLLRPESSTPGPVSIRVGLAIRAALDDFGVEAVSKWPNDLLLGGKKVCGVLCETRWKGNRVDWIAVGVGVNLKTPPREVAGATSLGTAGHIVDRDALLKTLIGELRNMGSGDTLTAAEVARFDSRHWLVGKAIAEPMAGVVEGIDPTGALVVRTETGMEALVAGHIVIA